MFYYLDAAPIIYLVEKVAPFYDQVTERIGKPEILLATCALSRLEARVKPVRDQNHARLQEFEEFFDNEITLEVGISLEVIYKATELRAKYNFKTPDALHLGAAITSACDVFLTNDHRLDRCTEIKIEILE